MTAQLLQGESAAVMATLPARSLDLVYLDPPYFSQQEWKGKAGAFSDVWRWDAEAEARLKALRGRHELVATMTDAIGGRAPFGSYLSAMAEILLEAHRLLRPTGCLWLQADDNAIHGLRIVLDVVFGREMWLGDVIWQRSAGKNSSAKRFGRNHDTITCYARARPHLWRTFRFDDTGIRETGRPLVSGILLNDRLNSGSSERVGYPTQKPLSLLDRLIVGSSLPGDVVLDPVMGSGTTIVSALRVGRNCVGIDRSADAIQTARRRLDAAPDTCARRRAADDRQPAFL